VIKVVAVTARLIACCNVDTRSSNVYSVHDTEDTGGDENV
jgi:hypothetical protein